MQIVGYINFKRSFFLKKEDAAIFYSNNFKDKQKEKINVMNEWIGKREGCYILEISKCFTFSSPINYKDLKIDYNFVAPQNYQYLKNEKLKCKLEEQKILSERSF